MTKRVTLADVAKKAGVSSATVDRVLSGRASVSGKRAELVYEAARELGYYGVPALRARIPAKRSVIRLGLALRRRHNFFYMAIEGAIRAASTRFEAADIDLKVAYQSNNSPHEAASLIRKLAESCDAVAIMAPDHPVVTAAVAEARSKNVFVFSILSDFAIDLRQAYLGLDNRKAGRSAAWGVVHTSQRPGALCIVVGNYSYLAQEMREAGFRAYIRENQPSYSVVDTVAAAESEDDVRIVVERLLDAQPDLVGLYMASGGFEGAVEALKRRDKLGAVSLVCNEITPSSRQALVEQAAAMVIATPVDQLAEQLIAEAVHAVSGKADDVSKPGPLPFAIYIAENL